MNLPFLRRTNGIAELIVASRPFLMLAGELHNSASSSLAHLETLWPRLQSLNLNTVLAPVTWELIEPKEGCFDFSLVDGLISEARQRHIRLVLLWFGTYKNAGSTYVPPWVKTDTRRFPRAQTTPGVPNRQISVFCEAVLQADCNAFAAFMRHICTIDAEHQTVLMVQVENEVGILDGPRDVSVAAEAAWRQPVPTALMERLAARRNSLRPEFASAWEAASGCAVSGTWATVFGAAAAEVFMAWYMARFLNRVTEAGRAEYDLPMFANAWLVQQEGQAPGAYPSGGPVSRMFDVWRAGAPALEALAPDIYIPTFKQVCADYAWGGNPLLIPEARNNHTMAAHALYAFGEHKALCFSPFAVEDATLPPERRDNLPAANPVMQIDLGATATPADATLYAETNRLLADLMPVLSDARVNNRVRGFLQTDNERVAFDLGGYRVHITWIAPYNPDQAPGAGLVIETGADRFLIVGFRFQAHFLPPAGQPGYVIYLEIWEGDFRNGAFVSRRRLNGDEYELVLGAHPAVLATQLGHITV